jgi:hypothetical protein
MHSEQDFAIIKLSERIYIANSSLLLLSFAKTSFSIA